MKSRLVWTCIALTFAGPALADDGAGREEGIGMLSGGTAGALVGGPVGAMVGVMIGGLFGERVRIASEATARADRMAGEADVTRAQLREETSRADRLAAEADGTRARLREATARIAALEDNRILEDLADRLTADVLFRTGSDALEPQAEHRLSELAGVLEEIQGARVELHGFADPRGDESCNRDLSERRARRVEEVLIAGGLDATRLTVVAHGESDSTALEGDQDAYAWERRVTLSLVVPAGQSVARLE